MNLLTIEDRILILQDRIDVLKAGFDESEARGADGKWVAAAHQTLRDQRAKEGLTIAIKDPKTKSVTVADNNQFVHEHILRSLPSDVQERGVYGFVTDGGKFLTVSQAEAWLVRRGRLIKAGFDPNQPRGKGGLWTSGGVVAGRVAAWASATKVGQAIKASATTENAKSVLATTIASILASPMNDDQAAEAVKQSILHAADGMRVTAEEAREHVVGTLNRLRAMRAKEKPDDPEVAKAQDAVYDQLTKLIHLIDNLDLENV